VTATPAHPLLLNAADHPREFDRLLVLADWCDEHGVSGPCGRCGGTGHHWVIGPTNVCPDCAGTGRTDAAVEALGWRLLAGQRRWPHGWPDLKLFWWWNGDEVGSTTILDVLPGKVWALLGAADRRGRFANYTTPAAALADAARAYGLAWLAGWRPKEVQRG
jgi:hypothetical protein